MAQTQDDESQSGWLPASYLDPVYADATDSSEDELATLPAVPERFITTSDYVATEADELSVLRGCVVDVLTKPMDGWWSCRYVTVTWHCSKWFRMVTGLYLTV